MRCRATAVRIAHLIPLSDRLSPDRLGGASRQSQPCGSSQSKRGDTEIRRMSYLNADDE
jgi:hypothetical protein